MRKIKKVNKDNFHYTLNNNKTVKIELLEDLPVFCRISCKDLPMPCRFKFNYCELE